MKNMQGHPEAPRLWSRHIDHIIQKYDMHPTHHEPCLYYGLCNGSPITLLRQVDDFAVAAPDEQTANILLDQIDDCLVEPLKKLGTISYFNGVDITQSRDYVKITCEKYLDRVMERHGWSTIAHRTTKNIPLSNDSKVIRALEETIGPTTHKEIKNLETKMGFRY